MLRAIDTETTGTNPDTDHVIEVATVDILPGGKIANQQSFLICAPVPISPASSAIHHLLDEDVTGKPPLAEVIDKLRGADALVAHRADFERSFLGKHLGETPNGQPVTWICTWKCALRVWPEAESHGNQSLRYQLGLASPFGIDRHDIVAHRALGDAIVTAAIFVELLKHARWSQLALWSSEPALHTTLTFGKHRGVKYADVPRDYLESMLRSDMDADQKFSAAHWLKQREAA